MCRWSGVSHLLLFLRHHLTNVCASVCAGHVRRLFSPATATAGDGKGGRELTHSNLLEKRRHYTRAPCLAPPQNSAGS
uniref:Putative secreted peptide n=1 Tax=Anopheles braziliensis TaxID=58242 RepID=A0A2M3ZW74_9DIPT